MKPVMGCIATSLQRSRRRQGLPPARYVNCLNMVPKRSCTPLSSVCPSPPLPRGVIFRIKALAVELDVKLLPGQKPSRWCSAARGRTVQTPLRCRGVRCCPWAPGDHPTPPHPGWALCLRGGPAPAPRQAPRPRAAEPSGMGQGEHTRPRLAPSFRFVLLGLPFYIFLVSRVCVFSPPCYGSGAPC